MSLGQESLVQVSGPKAKGVTYLSNGGFLSEGGNDEVLGGPVGSILEPDSVAGAVNVVLLLGPAGAADDAGVHEVHGGNVGLNKFQTQLYYEGSVNCT